MTSAANPERAYVQDHRDDLLADLDQLAAHPRHQRPARAPRRRRGQRRVVRGRAAAHRLPRCRGLVEGPWLAGGLRRVAERRRGRPDRARLRPPRRAAGRPGRAVAHRSVRPDAGRRRAAGPRRVRRQGPAAVPPAGRARPPGRDRPHQPGGAPEVPRSRARRSPARRTSRSCCERRATASPATSWSSPTPACVAPDVPSTVTGMRGHGVGDGHPARARTSTCTPASSAVRCPTPPPRSPGSSAALHDDQGRVQVPGFYDDVLELTDTERELFARVPADDAEFLDVAQSRALHGEAGFTTLERIGARPTAEVNGIGGGYQGAGAQDDRAERRLRQAQLPPGRRPGPGEDRGRRRAVRRRAHPGPASRPNWSGRVRASGPALYRSAHRRTPR